MCWSNTLAHQIFFLRNLCLVFPAGYTQTQYLYIYTHTYPKQLQYLYAWRSTWFYIFYRYERCCPAHHPHLHFHILLFLLRSSKMSKWSTISKCIQVSSNSGSTGLSDANAAYSRFSFNQNQCIFLAFGAWFVNALKWSRWSRWDALQKNEKRQS